jgi:hypothetical protein
LADYAWGCDRSLPFLAEVCGGARYRGQGVDIADMEEDKALLLSMGHIEVEEWVEEEEELFPEDDDAEFLAIVEEFETGFDDDDDALLLAV